MKTEGSPTTIDLPALLNLPDSTNNPDGLVSVSIGIGDINGTILADEYVYSLNTSIKSIHKSKSHNLPQNFHLDK